MSSLNTPVMLTKGDAIRTEKVVRNIEGVTRRRADAARRQTNRLLANEPILINMLIDHTVTPDGVWPKEYRWNEAVWDPELKRYERLLGPLARNWGADSLGVAINRVETVEGFGETVGPYGVSIEDTEGIVISVLPIPGDEPVEGRLEYDKNGKAIVMFSAPNALEVTCATQGIQ